MQLSEAQIVKILIDRYQKTGKDLSLVIQDPVFKSLSLTGRMEALRDNATVLSQGINPNYAKKDYKTVATDTGLGALSGMIAVPMALSKSTLFQRLAANPNSARLPPSVISAGRRAGWRNALAFGGVLGGIGGGIAGWMDTSTAVHQRSKTKNVLSGLSQYPTDPNTVRSLSAIESMHTPNTVLKRLSDMISGNVRGAVENSVKAPFEESAMNYISARDPLRPKS
jgi:hypothetical protein